MEYQIKTILDDETGEIVCVESAIVGASMFITTETFQNSNAGLYPMMGRNNKIVGTQLVFGAKDS